MSSIPLLYGLVLSGGKSSRMGENKGDINYHGKAQSVYEADLLAMHCISVFISTSKASASFNQYDTIKDIYQDKGPLGGILSAIKYNDQVAWLSLSCDLPYLDLATIQALIQNRDATKDASCFLNKDSGMLEPLVTIWEPSIFPSIRNEFSKGNLSPREILDVSEINVIPFDEHYKLKSCNTPFEREQAFAELPEN